MEEVMRRTLVLLGVIVFCAMLAAPASASEQGWHLRVFAAGFDPDLDETVPAENPDEVRVTGRTDLGFGASLEYRFSDRFGLEFGAIWGSPEVELSVDIPDYGHLSLTDAMSTNVITVDLDFHLTPNSRAFDVYLGAGIANVNFGNLHFVDPDGDPLDIKADGELTWSVKAGVDIALGENSRWAAVGGIRYIDSDIEVSNADDIEGGTATLPYNIFSFSVGVGYSF
jgi:opacity protein-like surface antigen